MAAAPAHTAPASTSSEPKAYSKEFEGMRASLLKSLSQLTPATSGEADKIGAQYFIQMNSPLPEFDTQLAKAYSVIDDRDPSRALYGLICSSKAPVRGKVLKALQGVNIPHVIPMVAYGLSHISTLGGKRMVIVYEKPRGKPLTALLAERKGTLPETFITEYLIAPIASAINHFGELGISHGRINPANIYIAENHVTLGECASEPCGYSQPYQYETPERAQANPAGRGDSTVEIDYYALGILGGFAKIGARFFEQSNTREKHVIRLLRDGAYQAMCTNLDLSDGMTDLLRGTLNDNVKERWTYHQIKLWAGGRRFNMLPPPPPPPGSRPLEIDRDSYINMRDLAEGLYRHWEQASPMLRDGTITRWVDLSVRRKDIVEMLGKAVNSLGGASPRNAAHNDELTARVIVILDPKAPLSMKDVRAQIDGLGGLLADSFRNDNASFIQHISELIEQGHANIWSDMQRRLENTISPDLTTMLWTLDRLRMSMRTPGYGFGMERLLYDLNPDLSCQSPLLGGAHVHTLKELLLALDRIAQEKARAEVPLDRHIAGFIASKLNLGREVGLTEYQNLPGMAKSKSFTALKLLEMAQEQSGRTRVPALTLWVGMEVLATLEHFHSKTLRKILQEGIAETAPGGIFRPMVEFLNQRSFVDVDMKGYNDAMQSYHSMRDEIAQLKDQRIVRYRASLSGYAAAKYIAHIGLLAVILMVLRNLWER